VGFVETGLGSFGMSTVLRLLEPWCQGANEGTGPGERSIGMQGVSSYENFFYNHDILQPSSSPSRI
jgi:hypothetical protein